MTHKQVALCYWRVFRMRENAKYKRVTEELNHTAPEGEKVVKAPEVKQGYDWQCVGIRQLCIAAVYQHASCRRMHVDFVHFLEHHHRSAHSPRHRNLRLMGKFFWPRMIASMFGWFLNDFVRGPTYNLDCAHQNTGLLRKQSIHRQLCGHHRREQRRRADHLAVDVAADRRANVWLLWSRLQHRFAGLWAPTHAGAQRGLSRRLSMRVLMLVYGFSEPACDMSHAFDNMHGATDDRLHGAVPVLPHVRNLL